MQVLHSAVLVSVLSLAACQPAGSNPEETPTTQTTQATESNDVVLGTIDTIESTILGEDRDLWIYLPRSVEDEHSDNIYPVVYLLDGNGHFRSVSGMIYQLSTVNGNKKIPEMIVVGIPNTDRFRDLTPTHTEGTSGGGTAFLDFVENEVIPHVESNYPASQHRTFIGHSLGGLMAIEALITRPEVFTNYVAIDPSLWWDEQSVLHRAEAALDEMDFSGKSLFVSIANTMPPGMTVDEVVEDDQERTTHIRSILQYSRNAESNSRSGLNFEWAYYDEDSHGSVPLISEYDAFKFLYPWYEPDSDIFEMINSDMPDNPELALQEVTGHYAMLSERLGFNHPTPRSWAYQVAMAFQFNDKPESALAFFQYNLQNFPSHPLSHESIGDFYLLQEDEESARLHFQHALDRGADFDIDSKFAQSED